MGVFTVSISRQIYLMFVYLCLYTLLSVFRGRTSSPLPSPESSPSVPSPRGLNIASMAAHLCLPKGYRTARGKGESRVAGSLEISLFIVPFLPTTPLSSPAFLFPHHHSSCLPTSLPLLFFTWLTFFIVLHPCVSTPHLPQTYHDTPLSLPSLSALLSSPSVISQPY